jgi:hypothetical protein
MFLGFYSSTAEPMSHVTLSLVLYPAAHDLEHVGLTNDFLINIEDDLAVTYNDRWVGA